MSPASTKENKMEHKVTLTKSGVVTCFSVSNTDGLNVYIYGLICDRIAFTYSFE